MQPMAEAAHEWLRRLRRRKVPATPRRQLARRCVGIKRIAMRHRRHKARQLRNSGSNEDCAASFKKLTRINFRRTRAGNAPIVFRLHPSSRSAAFQGNDLLAAAVHSLNFMRSSISSVFSQALT